MPDDRLDELEVSGRLYLYTDGSCDNDQEGCHAGSWAYTLVRDNKILWEATGYELDTTNNRMELMAVLQALAMCMTKAEPLFVVSDSYYTKSMVQLYKRPPFGVVRERHHKNLDLIKQVVSLCQLHEVYFIWVKGHSGIRYNEYVDKLCDGTRRAVLRTLAKGKRLPDAGNGNLLLPERRSGTHVKGRVLQARRR